MEISIRKKSKLTADNLLKNVIQAIERVGDKSSEKAFVDCERRTRPEEK